jgi:hypothetical protein
MVVAGLAFLTVVSHKLLSSENPDINISTEKPPSLRGTVVLTQDHLPTPVKDEYSLHKTIPVSNGHYHLPREPLSQKLKPPTVKPEELSDPIDFKTEPEPKDLKESTEIKIKIETLKATPSPSKVIPEEKLEQETSEEEAQATDASPQQPDPVTDVPQTIPDLSVDAKQVQLEEPQLTLPSIPNRSVEVEHTEPIPTQTESPIDTQHSIPDLPVGAIDTQLPQVDSQSEGTLSQVKKPSPEQTESPPAHSIPDLSSEDKHIQSADPSPHQTETPVDTSEKVPDLPAEPDLVQTSVPVVPSVTTAEKQVSQEPPKLVSGDQEGNEQKIEANSVFQEGDVQTQTLVSGYSAGETLFPSIFPSHSRHRNCPIDWVVAHCGDRSRCGSSRTCKSME